MNSYVLKNADRLTFVASDLMEMADLIEPIKKKSIVFHNSFDPAIYEIPDDNEKKAIKEFKDRMGTSKNRLIIGTSGIIRQKKGFVYAWKAFEMYRKKHDGAFLLVGDFHNSEKEFYINLIEGSRYNKDFFKTGVIDHKSVLGYMEKIDIFLLPSLTEGCSNAMLEAMHLKKPIIATSVGAAKDLLDKKFLIGTRDPSQIYEKIVEFSKIRSAEHKSLKKLTPVNESNDWLGLYKQIVKN
jgi:glycosyltransferase involved in cell wall biosynthesis